MRDTDAQAPTDLPKPTAPKRPLEEISRLGDEIDEIYERDIRHLVEADHVEEVVAIDVESGSWAMGKNVIVATERLRMERPAAIDVWCLRVGHRALYHFGGRSRRMTKR